MYCKCISPSAATVITLGTWAYSPFVCIFWEGGNGVQRGWGGVNGRHWRIGGRRQFMEKRGRGVRYAVFFFGVRCAIFCARCMHASDIVCVLGMAKAMHATRVVYPPHPHS